jgi:acylphosphatase
MQFLQWSIRWPRVSQTRTQPATDHQRRIIHFHGRVQGVGFRYTTRNIVLRYDVSGYVRNLPDGRVQLLMEGCDSEMQQVVDELHRKMSCFIRKIDSDTSPATGEFEQFSIRH